MYFGFASTEYPGAVRSITPPRKKNLPPSFSIRPAILIATCFERSSTNFKTLLFRSKQQTVINMNENICVRLIVSEALGIRPEWVVVQTFQDTHKVLVPQFRCFAITLQRFLQFPHFVFFQSCIIPLVRFWLPLQTSLGQHLRAGMLCVRQSQL